MRNKFNKQTITFLILLIILISASLIFSLINTYIAINKLKSLDLASASQHANQALPMAQLANQLTLHQIPDLYIWQEGLNLIKLSSTLQQDVNQFISISNQENPTLEIYQQRISQQLQLIEEKVSLISDKTPSSILAKKKIGDQVAIVNTYISDFNQIFNYLSQGRHQIIVILQNNQEIRASGGFMGSFALITIEDGLLKEVQIQDIYQVDGQFEGYIEAPRGVKEYLSSGNGLRLPDANWHPDFPSSSTQIMRFFALADTSAIEGIIAINLSFVEDAFRIIGDVYLPDYDQQITAENLAEVARADRENFFPGSQQKPQFLSSLTKVLEQKISYLDLEQKKQLLKLALNNVDHQEIQFFHIDPQIEQIFQTHHLAGELTLSENLFYLVESNVGINKANKGIQREVELNISDYRTIARINFSNKNTQSDRVVDEHLGYVNYQRLILHPNYKVLSISYQGQSIENWDEDQITNSRGETFKQIGFLITLLEEQTSTLEIELEHPQIDSQDTFNVLKQPGLPATPYLIRYHDRQQTFLLEKNISIVFQ